MAKTIYICSRETLPDSVGEKLFKICKQLEPDNIVANEPKIVVNKKNAFGIMNPTKSNLVKGNSLLMGHLFDQTMNWDVPQDVYPDGSYAIFRDGEKYFELVTDVVASRTIWYFHNENYFISSTSQRAIIMFLGSFEFDESVIPWMLSTGTLGPGYSWDKRIKCMPADSVLLLNKEEWTISCKSNPVEFKTDKRTDEQHEIMLIDAIQATFQSLKLDYSKWALPLSGGYDSRGILCFLDSKSEDFKNLKTLTWGLSSSQGVEGNDAYVAFELANAFKLSNNYYHTDQSEEKVDILINRFLLIGEGRTDNLKGYMDGFNVWKSIFEDGIEGIIRGDEGFGCNTYNSSAAVRLNEGCALCSDFSNLKDYQKYGFKTQEFPQNLKQRQGESLIAWTDRIFHSHDLPTEFSALSDLKLSFVEVINPLLSKKILIQVRQLPDHLRSGKSLFKKIVVSYSPDIDFAKKEATESGISIMKHEEFVRYLKNGLSLNSTKALFPADFLETILQKIDFAPVNVSKKELSARVKSLIKKVLPKFIKERLKENVMLPTLDENILAFRILLISNMYKILSADSLSITIK